MPLSRVEVITSVERRRRWPRAEKERLVALALEPGASAIARSAGVHVSQLFRLRRQLCERVTPQLPAFLLIVEPPADPVSTPDELLPRKRNARRESRIEIELASGDRLRLEGEVDGRTLRAAISALRAR
ncbi:IS66-like element accessory protein TnpA [Xanthobacter wiegelii]|uniref:IS66-like element accessory protein TnpA n=1 Tax=Xanthobacter wiegelii TaxID=3119913 RepID=UPI0037296560